MLIYKDFNYHPIVQSIILVGKVTDQTLKIFRDVHVVLRTIPSKLGFLFSTKLSTDGVFNIGVGVEHPKMRNYMEERDIWAGPHLVIVISSCHQSYIAI